MVEFWYFDFICGDGYVIVFFVVCYVGWLVDDGDLDGDDGVCVL